MRYNKSETRIINNAIKMADEVKKYHERTQSWDIPEHLIVDGCKVGKWWIVGSVLFIRRNGTRWERNGRKNMMAVLGKMPMWGSMTWKHGTCILFPTATRRANGWDSSISFPQSGGGKA